MGKKVNPVGEILKFHGIKDFKTRKDYNLHGNVKEVNQKNTKRTAEGPVEYGDTKRYLFDTKGRLIEHEFISKENSGSEYKVNIYNYKQWEISDENENVKYSLYVGSRGELDDSFLYQMNADFVPLLEKRIDDKGQYLLSKKFHYEDEKLNKITFFNSDGSIDRELQCFYDSRGLLTKQQYVTAATGETYLETIFSYDRKGVLKREQYSLQEKNHLKEFDVKGNCIKETILDEKTQTKRIEKFEYDFHDNLVKKRDSSGKSVFRYDKYSNITSVA